jgi:hypothetical protein
VRTELEIYVLFILTYIALLSVFFLCHCQQINNSKDMLGYAQSRPLSSCNSIKAFGFSSLYTTISHCKLKNRLKELVQLCFIKTNGQRRYKYFVLGRDSTKKFSETDITVTSVTVTLKLDFDR